MDPNPPDQTAPPEYHRVKSPPCGSCGYATSVRLEHVIHGDDVTSTWRCEVCGARWPAEQDLGSPAETPQSNVAGAASASPRPGLDTADGSGHNIMFAYLSELIDTLDRRVPRGHAATENQIARAATALRREMLEALSLRRSDGLTVLQRS